MQVLRIVKALGVLSCLLLLLQNCEREAFTPFATGLEKSGNGEEVCTATIDFEPLEKGTIVSALASGAGVSGVVTPGNITVYGENLRPGRPAENHAMIFDTENPTGGDEDLVVPGADYKKVLIISEDLDGDDPDDNAKPGGTFSFDFSNFGPGKVNVKDFVAIDTEEGGSFAAYAAGMVLITSGPIGKIADATDQDVTVNAENVVYLIVHFEGSGAMDNVCLTFEEEEEDGCTYTQGYWKNPKKGDWPAPYDRDDPFFESGQTWQEVITSPVKNNAYYQAAHQFIAAVLNSANGASTPPAVDAAIAAATALFDEHEPSEIKALPGDDPLRQQFIAISETLDSYNMGIIGPGHCDD